MIWIERYKIPLCEFFHPSNHFLEKISLVFIYGENNSLYELWSSVALN